MTATVSSSGGSNATATLEVKGHGPSSFVAALNRMHRFRKPGKARSKCVSPRRHHHPRIAPSPGAVLSSSISIKMTAAVSGGSNALLAPHQGKNDKAPRTSPFLAALNRRHRGLNKPRSKSSHPRRAPGPSYAKAARLQPKMFTSAHGQAKKKISQAASSKIVRKRSRGKISGEEPLSPQSQSQSMRVQEHEEVPREEKETPGPSAGTAEAVADESPRKKARRRFSPLPVSPSFLKSDLLRRRYGGGGLVRRRLTKVVTFANPIVVEVRFRPRTSPKDVSKLFYNRSDETRFRREERLRRDSLTCIADCDSDDETEVEESDTEEVVAVVVATVDDCEAKLPLTPQVRKGEVDPNEITESDDSSGSSDDDADE